MSIRGIGVKEQQPNEGIDVADWRADDEFAVYPVGARDKSLLISPNFTGFNFLLSDHRYLFKYSELRYPNQYWAEIIAYQAGCLLGVSVPPAFVSYNSNNGECGSLIEWFFGYSGMPIEGYVPGGDIMVSIMPSYERKAGKQHNFDIIEKYFSVLNKAKFVDLADDWRLTWCDMFLFDALIGNTDRHQDNWGLLWSAKSQDEKHFSVRVAPAYDNGTSLGYELMEQKMPAILRDNNRITAYISRGRHHIRWKLTDERSCQHGELLCLLANKYPDLKLRMVEKLTRFDIAEMERIIMNLVKFNVTVPLSLQRAEFVCNLFELRKNRLLDSLG